MAKILESIPGTIVAGVVLTVILYILARIIF